MFNFTREELWAIRTKADQESRELGVNQHWKRALENLSVAADHLDAMIARSSVMQNGPACMQVIDITDKVDGED